MTPGHYGADCPARAPGRARPVPSRPPRAPGFILGLGLGGFIDGIVLHQVLQWHHMLTGTDAYPSATLAGLEANTLADGFFHLVDLDHSSRVATALIVRAWQRGELAPPWRAHVGMLLAGWGVFNVVGGPDRSPAARHPPRARRPRRAARLGPRVPGVRGGADRRRGRARSFGRAVLALTSGQRRRAGTAGPGRRGETQGARVLFSVAPALPPPPPPGPPATPPPRPPPRPPGPAPPPPYPPPAPPGPPPPPPKPRALPPPHRGGPRGPPRRPSAHHLPPLPRHPPSRSSSSPSPSTPSPPPRRRGWCPRRDSTTPSPGCGREARSAPCSRPPPAPPPPPHPPRPAPPPSPSRTTPPPPPLSPPSPSPSPPPPPPRRARRRWWRPVSVS